MGKEDLSPFGNALAGAFGGIISNAIVYPLDTVKTRIQAETRIHNKDIRQNGEKNTVAKDIDTTSTRAVLKHILDEYGLAGFYRGFFASMVNTFSMQFAYFYWYSIVRASWTNSIQPRLPIESLRRKGSNTAVELSLGAVAGALAQLFTIPVSVIATRQQLSSHSDHKSVLDTGMEIIQQDGIRGLWKGLKPSLVLTVNPAITYGAFERLKNALVRGKMTPWKAFMIGALSKTLATVITYPYIMAKVRLQARYEEEEGEGEGEGEEREEGEVKEDDVTTEKKNELGNSSYVSVPTTEPKRKNKKSNQRYNGALDVLGQTYREKGPLGWYQGMQAQITKAVLSQALLFGIKEELEELTILLLAALARFAVKDSRKSGK